MNPVDKQPLAAYLQQHVPVGGAALAAILAQFEPLDLRKQELLVRQGRVGDNSYFLVEGWLRAFTVDQQGNEVTTFFYGPPQVVYEVSSFYLRIPASESIEALVDCRGYVLPLDRLNALFHAVPEFREFGRQMLVRHFTAFKQRTLGLISETAEVRYQRLLADSPDLFRHAPLKHIASYLGVTDTSLSRIRRGA